MELRRYWSYHPKYRDDIVDNIQGKYSFKERPQVGIILKNASGNQFQLAADNFQGTVISYITLAKLEGAPGLAIEWIRENGAAIGRNGGLFPSLPGIYFIEITDITGDPRSCTSFEYYVDPLLDVIDEQVFQTGASTYALSAGKYLDGTLRLWAMADNRTAGGMPINEGVNYTANPNTGEITMLIPLATGEFLSADYRYPGDSVGPFQGLPNRAGVDAIPGVVLAFGRRIEKGDKMAVVVSRNRSPSALEYGGRWSLSIDADVVARDPYDQREILDQTCIWLWAILRPQLSTEGIEILGVNMGGETEEVYDENSDDYFYNASFSLQIETEWSIHVPIAATIQRVQGFSNDPTLSGLTDEQVAEVQSNLVALENLGLRSFQDPWFGGKDGRTGRSLSFEVIR